MGRQSADYGAAGPHISVKLGFDLSLPHSSSWPTDLGGAPPGAVEGRSATVTVDGTLPFGASSSSLSLRLH